MWKAANKWVIQVGLIKTGELLQVHRISEVLTEKEKNTTVSYSNGWEEKKKKTFYQHLTTFSTQTPGRSAFAAPPCCDQPIFSFVFHLLPWHRQVPLSKWRCCNEAKLLLINEKASSSAATVRSATSEPAAAIHTRDRANFASSHSVTVPWYIFRPGHGCCTLIFKQTFLCFWVCRGLICSTPSLPGRGKPIVLAGLCACFPAMLVFDLQGM